MDFDLKIEMEKVTLFCKFFMLLRNYFSEILMWNLLNFSFSMSQAQKVGSSPKLESDRGQVCTCMKRLTGSLRTGNMFYLRLTIFDDDEIAQIFRLLKKCPRCACVT